MKFNIDFSNKSVHDLNVTISNHVPLKKVSLMDENWTFKGYSMNDKNGPFYIAASKKSRDLATFTGKIV